MSAKLFYVHTNFGDISYLKLILASEQMFLFEIL